MKRSHFGAAYGVALGLILGASSASAQQAKGQQAAAEALFEQATSLVDAGRIAEACEKFAASQELDPGLGTQLHLADCYDRAGRSASAWALFREVEERSHRDNQTDRERIASERASSLESKLSRLELHVQPGRQVPGLTLSLGGAGVPKASWNVALPVDPGKLRLEVTAPGRRPWAVLVDVPTGPTTRVVDVPLLALAPPSEPAPGAAPDSTRNEGSARRTLGLLTGGLGLAALAAGGYFGYRAYSFNQSSKAECRTDSPNACTPEGASLREQAADAARVSTIASVSGAVLIVGGVTLVLTAPSPLRDTQRREGVARADSTWQVQLAGVW